MKKSMLISFAVALSILGCNSSSNSTTDETSSSSSLQEASSSSNSPTDNTASSSSLQEASSSSSSSQNEQTHTLKREHHQGEDCLICHGIGVEQLADNDESFTSGATIFTQIDASNKSAVADGYSLKLILEHTNEEVVYKHGNGDANVLTYFPQGRINTFTAQVIDANGDVVNTSITNSHDVSRMHCNHCHAKSGLNGAPGRIVSYDYYNTLGTTLK